MIKSLLDLNFKEGQRVILRTDWNVPLQNDLILNNAKIDASRETIDFLIKKGLKIIILNHLSDKNQTILPIFNHIQKSFWPNSVFVENPFDQIGLDILNSLKNGEIAVVENMRFWKEEEENDNDFAEKLSKMGDFYINDAFSVSHRKHASVVGIPNFLPKCAGFRFFYEYNHLLEVFNPEHPFLLILGGAKFETKIPLVNKFLNIADSIFIGGANAFSASLSEIAKNPKVILPSGDLKVLDLDDQNLNVLSEIIKKSKFILWNGPLGKYEDGFIEGTKKLIKILAESGAKVVIGGGDTEGFLGEYKNSFHFVSLSGGAMLDFLAEGNLVGIDALEDV